MINLESALNSELFFNLNITFTKRKIEKSISLRPTAS